MEAQHTPPRKKAYNNVWTGVLFVLVGGLLLLRQTGYPLPFWLFTWPMILITLGLFTGIRNRFSDFGWLIFVIVGFVFLSDDIWPSFNLREYALPVIIIAIGLLFILAPRRVCKGGHRGRFRKRNGEPANQDAAVQTGVYSDMEATQETVLDITSIFAGIKKKVLSKQFRGGEVVCVFGGAEINLANADFQSPIVIDVVNVFGGTKMVVPANWEIRSEVTAIFGGIDDKRPHIANLVPEKTVIIKGTIMFGGIEVNSY